MIAVPLLYVAMLCLVVLAVIGGVDVIGRVGPATQRPRLSGNCGPAAQGLTPDGDVVPIKVDRRGRVLPAREETVTDVAGR